MSNRSRQLPPSGPPLTPADLPVWRSRFPGYSMYYLDKLPRLSGLERKIRVIASYIKTNLSDHFDQIEEQGYFELNCERLPVELRSNWPEFGTDLMDSALEVSNLFGVVMHKILFERRNEDQTVASEMEHVRRVHGGLVRYNPVTPLIHINSAVLGKFVTIRGTVVRIGAFKPHCIQLAFSCLKCENEFSMEQPAGIFTVPEKCYAHDDCKSKLFRPVESSPQTVLVDARLVRIQDTARSDLEVGDVPRMMDCQITDSMVDKCNNGDAVTISGVVKAKREQELRGTEKGLHSFYVEVVGVKAHKESKRTIGGHWFSLSNSDYYAIREIHDTEDLFRLLVNSLCPSIYGHELVKAALVLSLFGGGQARKDSLIPRRDDINVLMVGDPGVGKSQILKSVANVAPRSVYVCGTGSTVAGLTVTLVKEGEGYAVEAGALVMSDCGTCCIDEFEKMPALHDALLEAMEQQTVSVAKSGVNRRFPARTTVVAASNPEDGHYDPYKSFSENVRVSPALLSRFDVVFLMLDTPDKGLDQQIVDHILGTRASATGPEGDVTASKCLRLSLCRRPGERIDYIPAHLIRKYVAYARHYVHPQLSAEAKSALKTYYLRLRVRRRNVADAAPVTARQLESLMRLTEARAKVNLRETATLEDAAEVLEIYESGLCSIDDESLLNMEAQIEELPATAQPGPSGVQKQAKTLYLALQKMAETQNKNIFTVHEMEMAMRKATYSATVETLVSILNDQGKLLRKAGHTYQLSD